MRKTTLFLLAAVVAVSTLLFLGCPNGSTDKDTVATPTADIVAGDVPAGTQITLSSTTEGASIYYTTDGSTPGSVLYTGPITLTKSATIKAVAKKSGWNDSGIMTNSYVAKYNKYRFVQNGANGVTLDLSLFDDGNDTERQAWITANAPTIFDNPPAGAIVSFTETDFGSYYTGSIEGHAKHIQAFGYEPYVFWKRNPALGSTVLYQVLYFVYE
ncbi:hypothetical protein FACS189485_21760 [Spirochaetia bacterium]|nr:hypothetical protein FACS189485_21760 [Spirochaetia bacterium]